MNTVSYSSSQGTSQPEGTLSFTPEPIGSRGADGSAGKHAVRQHISPQRLAGFLAIFVVIVAVAWWGLNMGKAPVPRQLPAPDPGSDILLSQNASPPELSPSDASPPANVAVPPDAPSVSTNPAPVVRQDHISDLLAAGDARARSSVVNGKKIYKVEFLTTKGTVADVYSVNALSREGWKLSVFPDRQMAKLSNDREDHDIPVVDSSSNSNSKKSASNRSSKTAKRIHSKLSPVGDHKTVTYIKLP